jgi:hypothetical protein
MVKRTARLCTAGMNNRPNSAATRNPIPKYMIDSIMMYAFGLAAAKIAKQLYPLG